MLQRRTVPSTVKGLRCIHDYESQLMQPSETYTQPHFAVPNLDALDGGDGRTVLSPDISRGSFAEQADNPYIYSAAPGETELTMAILASSVASNGSACCPIWGSDRRN